MPDTVYQIELKARCQKCDAEIATGSALIEAQSPEEAKQALIDNLKQMAADGDLDWELTSGVKIHLTGIVQAPDDTLADEEPDAVVSEFDDANDDGFVVVPDEGGEPPPPPQRVRSNLTEED